jgi:transcriptional regulator with XRE-family HTH domain
MKLGDPVVLVRQEIGDVLRDFRLQKGQTLRQVAGRATVALGYLSEVERGQKEASSEILASLADALEVPISVIMREVSDRLALVEGVNLEAAFASDALSGSNYIPDTVPASFLADTDPSLASTR